MARAKTKAPADGPALYTVPLELGGRELVLEFNYKAYMAMFEYTGVDLLGEWQPSQLGPRGTVCFLMAGALTHHPDLDLEWCMGQMRGRDTKRVLEALFDAYKRSLPEVDPETAANPPQPVM